MGSQHRGNTGQRVSTFLRDNTSQITAASPKPRVLVVQGGTNDVAGAVTIGDAVTPGTFTGDYKTMLVNLGAGLTAPTVMVCRGIMPKTGSAPAVIAPYNTAIQVAIAAYMATNPAVPAYYNSADAWLIPATDLGDRTHPNDIGSAKVAAHEIPAVQAAYFVRSFSWM